MSSDIRFSQEAAVSLVNAIVSASEVLEEENGTIQKEFDALGSTFKDSLYGEFKEEFEKGDQAVSKTVQSMRELCMALLKYAEALTERLKVPNG